MSEAKARELLRELVEAWGPDGGWSAGGVDRWNKAIDAGRAYLAAVPAPPVGPRVPREPSESMVQAAYDIIPIAPGTETWSIGRYPHPDEIWRAMYDAAPAAEPVAQPERIACAAVMHPRTVAG